MNNSYRSFMEQQCLSKQAKQAFYYNLQRGGHKNSLRIPIKAAAIAVCVILLIPITVLAAETIFDIGIIEIISGRTSSGKYGGRNGFETSYPSVSSRPLSDFSEKIRSVDGHTSTVYESWKAAEEDLGIILVNNTILSNESITKAYTYNLKAAGIKRPVHCYAVYNGKDHQLYRAVLTAAYRYKETHIALRATVTCKHPGIPAEEDGAREIALRSRGTPRIANRLLKRVRDFAQVKGSGVIDRASADLALSALEIDRLGLDNTDRRMLESIITKFGGGPVGLETLAATIGEESVTLEDVYEPYLMQIGFVNRTPRGRCVTKAAYDHLGIPFAGQLEF